MAHLHMVTENCYLAWFNEINHLCLAAAQSCLISSHGPGAGITMCTGSGAVSVLFPRRDSDHSTTQFQTTAVPVELATSWAVPPRWFAATPRKVPRPALRSDWSLLTRSTASGPHSSPIQSRFSYLPFFCLCFAPRSVRTSSPRPSYRIGMTECPSDQLISLRHSQGLVLQMEISSVTQSNSPRELPRCPTKTPRRTG
jgi:hypothetical protein